MEEKLNKLKEMKMEARQGGGAKRIDQQHQRGKLTARERIELLLDKGSFCEIGTLVVQRFTEFGLKDKKYPGDAVVTGSGTVNGRQVFLYSQDFTVMGGSISEAVGLKVGQIMDKALANGAPLIAINDSGGARIQEGVASLCGVGEMLYRNTVCSGVIPQISVVVGPSAGGAVYCPAITDFIFMVEGISQMYITGPDVIKAVTGEQISHEELGGAVVHSKKSGVSHFNYKDEEECFKAVRRLLEFLPSSNLGKPLETLSNDNPERTDDSLSEIVPNDPRRAYDMKKVIASIADNGDFMEVHKDYAPNIIVGFTRLDGKAAGVVAQQPMCLAGVIDINASNKAARFVRFCDAFNIPLVSLVDVPGFLPGTEQEHNGIIRNGAKLIYAYAEATVPKITVITRKAYGGAYIVMSSKHLGGDLNYAWPNAEIAVMGAEGAVNVLYRKELAETKEPEQLKEKLVKEYKDKLSNPYEAAALGYIDDVIEPAQTRTILIKALRMLENKEQHHPLKKHGNIPL
ncbi:MAG: acyl-CoA carboxylase subunit beta [Chloroflexi bacterium]|nr:acyl-CoA carboxylase subunit beta [Chloroflexota bacterium]